nr:hypothetical protein [Methylobacterium aquaticum]
MAGGRLRRARRRGVAGRGPVGAGREDEADHPRKQPVVAVDEVDEGALLARPLERQGVAVDGRLLGVPCHGTAEPRERRIELAGIGRVPGERLRALAGRGGGGDLGVAAQALGLDRRGHRAGQVALQDVDEQERIVHQRLAPGIGHVLRLPAQAEAQQGMGEAVRHHRVAAPGDGALEPGQGLGQVAALEGVPGHERRLVGIGRRLGIGLEGGEIRRRHRLAGLVVQNRREAGADQVDADRREVVGGDFLAEPVDLGHRQQRQRPQEAGPALVGARAGDGERTSKQRDRLRRPVGAGESLGGAPGHLRLARFDLRPASFGEAREVVPAPGLHERPHLVTQKAAGQGAGERPGGCPARLGAGAVGQRRLQGVEAAGIQEIPEALLVLGARLGGPEVGGRRPAREAARQARRFGGDPLGLALGGVVAQRRLVGPGLGRARGRRTGENEGEDQRGAHAGYLVLRAASARSCRVAG